MPCIFRGLHFKDTQTVPNKLKAMGLLLSKSLIIVLIRKLIELEDCAKRVQAHTNPLARVLFHAFNFLSLDLRCEINLLDCM